MRKFCNLAFDFIKPCTLQIRSQSDFTNPVNRTAWNFFLQRKIYVYTQNKKASKNVLSGYRRFQISIFKRPGIYYLLFYCPIMNKYLFFKRLFQIHKFLFIFLILWKRSRGVFIFSALFSMKFQS